MRGDVDLDKRTVVAIRHYREALALAETLEQEEADARRELANTLLDLGRAMDNGAAPSQKDRLFKIGLAAASRSDKACAALSEATARVDSARLALAALERLGYFPKAPTALGNPT